MPSAETRQTTSTIHLILYTLFFLSGCSALIYQIMWQRMLFTVFGVDLISVTIIISIFMFGLGLGGLLGGYIADRMTSHLLTLYIVTELCIALFGFASPVIIDSLGDLFFSQNELVTACACFMILAIPTILMGATFPILVVHVNKQTHNIGESVGALYFVNTSGAAAGAYLSGFVFLYYMDAVGAITFAAGLNLLIAVIAFLAFRRK
jgi:predicted membrane-bound spermidine synthase